MTEWEFEIDGQNIIGYIEDNKLTIPNYYDKEPLTKCEVDNMAVYGVFSMEIH